MIHCCILTAAKHCAQWIWINLRLRTNSEWLEKSWFCHCGSDFKAAAEFIESIFSSIKIRIINISNPYLFSSFAHSIIHSKTELIGKREQRNKFCLDVHSSMGSSASRIQAKCTFLRKTIRPKWVVTTDTLPSFTSRQMLHFQMLANAAALITYFLHSYLVDLFICYVPPSSIPLPLQDSID